VCEQHPGAVPALPSTGHGSQSPDPRSPPDPATTQHSHATSWIDQDHGRVEPGRQSRLGTSDWRVNSPGESALPDYAPTSAPICAPRACLLATPLIRPKTSSPPLDANVLPETRSHLRSHDLRARGRTPAQNHR
jgi:hypothetical protein